MAPAQLLPQRRHNLLAIVSPPITQNFATNPFAHAVANSLQARANTSARHICFRPNLGLRTDAGKMSVVIEIIFGKKTID